MRKLTTIVGLAALMAAVMSPSFAAPVLTNTAAVKTAIADDLIDVHWGWGWGAGAFVGGLALGAALATPYYAYSYPYYGYPYYGYHYAYPHYGHYYYPHRYYGWRWGARRAYWGWYGRW